MRTNIRSAKESIADAISAIDQELISLFVEAEKNEINDVIKSYIRRNLDRINKIDFNKFKEELAEAQNGFGLSGQLIKFKLQDKEFPFAINHNQKITMWDGSFDQIMSNLKRVKKVIAFHLLDNPQKTESIESKSILNIITERKKLREVFNSLTIEEDTQIFNKVIKSL